MWNDYNRITVIQTKRSGRVIILTTHFMDEADILGDRIGTLTTFFVSGFAYVYAIVAIMANGKLKCCGSSLFLKSRYGVGYQLSFALKSSEVDSTRIIEYIRDQIPETTTLDSSGAQLLVQIPLKHVSRFGSLFTGLDERLHELQIEAYGASITTLEEVFMRIANGSLSDSEGSGSGEPVLAEEFSLDSDLAQSLLPVGERK